MASYGAASNICQARCPPRHPTPTPPVTWRAMSGRPYHEAALARRADAGQHHAALLGAEGRVVQLRRGAGGRGRGCRDGDGRAGRAVAIGGQVPLGGGDVEGEVPAAAAAAAAAREDGAGHGGHRRERLEERGLRLDCGVLDRGILDRGVAAAARHSATHPSRPRNKVTRGCRPGGRREASAPMVPGGQPPRKDGRAADGSGAECGRRHS